MTQFFYVFEKSPVTVLNDDEVMCVLERLSPKEAIIMNANGWMYKLTRPVEYHAYHLYNYHNDLDSKMTAQQARTYVSTLLKMNYGG